MTTTPARPVTCPAWCRTDHVAERLRWARMQEQSARYMRAPETQPEMRRAFDPGFTPPAGDGSFVLFDSPLHELELGRAAGQDAVPVRAIFQQAAGGEQPTIELVPDQGGGDGTYTAQQARALADPLVRAARVLEAGRAPTRCPVEAHLEVRGLSPGTVRVRWQHLVRLARHFGLAVEEALLCTVDRGRGRRACGLPSRASACPLYERAAPHVRQVEPGAPRSAIASWT